MEKPSPAQPAPVHWKRIEIRQFRILEHLVLERPIANPDKGQWTLLIGENGVGKTSFLQALAFAAGNFEQIMPLARWLNANTSGNLAKVRLNFADGQFERKTGPKYPANVSGDVGPNWEVWAYGSQRGNSLGGPDRTVELQESSIDSLFDSKWRLIHAETWLKNLQLAALQENGRAARFLEAVKAVLKQILPDVEAVEVRSNDVFLNRKGEGQVPLQAWSDGYLTTAGWILDMIARWAARAWKIGAELDTDFAEKMTGLVLIDEIDLHLHPAWQTQVVRDLRRLFPKLSFVATTHNPLTLLGAEPGEIFVVRRNAEGRIEARQRDIPPGLDVDQVLTGDWFGLSSTLDQDTLELLDRHRAMLRQRIGPQDPVRQELEMTLRRRLGTFGATSIDRMTQEVAAELMPKTCLRSHRTDSPIDDRRRDSSFLRGPGRARQRRLRTCRHGTNPGSPEARYQLGLPGTRIRSLGQPALSRLAAPAPWSAT